MNSTKYTSLVFELTKLSIEDTWTTFYENTSGIGAFDIRSTNKLHIKDVSIIATSPYGIGYAGRKQQFYSRDLPFTTCFWDEIRTLKFGRSISYAGLLSHFLETDYFTIWGDLPDLGNLYLSISIYSFMAAKISGFNPPYMYDPVPKGILIANEMIEMFKDGYPYFENVEDANSFLKQIANAFLENANPNGSSSLENRLEELARLKEKNLISNEEYQRLRQRELGL